MATSPRLLQELLACILERLEGLLAVLVADGFAPLQQAYLETWLHTNQQVSKHPTFLRSWLCCAVTCVTFTGQLGVCYI